MRARADRNRWIIERRLRFPLQAAQIFFAVVGNAVTFDRFLNRFVMRPYVEFFLFDKRKSGIVLFCERRRKIPRDHHIDIVFVRTYL